MARARLVLYSFLTLEVLQWQDIKHARQVLPCCLKWTLLCNVYNRNNFQVYILWSCFAGSSYWLVDRLVVAVNVIFLISCSWHKLNWDGHKLVSLFRDHLRQYSLFILQHTCKFDSAGRRGHTHTHKLTSAKFIYRLPVYVALTSLMISISYI